MPAVLPNAEANSKAAPSATCLSSKRRSELFLLTAQDGKISPASVGASHALIIGSTEGTSPLARDVQRESNGCRVAAALFPVTLAPKQRHIGKDC